MKRILFIALILLFAAGALAAPPGIPPSDTPAATSSVAGKTVYCGNTKATAGTDTACAMTAKDANDRLTATTGPGITITTGISADATLSGTPVIITIYDKATGTPYYFKAYPVKP